MDGYSAKRIDELASIHRGAVKLAGDELGIESFGLQVLDLPPGFADYPERDHADDRQEEVYLVVEGSAEFSIGSERLHAEAGSLVRVAPEMRRKRRQARTERGSSQSVACPAAPTSGPTRSGS